MWRAFAVCVLILVNGCSSGAVVFAPTALPPDLSPLRYEHPGGVFSLSVPRHWPVHTQNTTTLASASFAPPGALDPALTVAVMKLSAAMNPTAFTEALNLYQTQIRPDVSRYKEESRQAMGDGSWRMSGLRTAAGGLTQQINTFFEQTGDFITLIEVIVPDDDALLNDIQAAINTIRIDPNAPLEVSELSTFVAVSNAALEINHLHAWTTPGGVFFITGEVANLSSTIISDIPVRAVLSTADGLPAAEAVDQVMGYGIQPGEYAPFSLRFGQGQPSLTIHFEVMLGSDDWQPGTQTNLYGANELRWVDDSAFDAQGRLVISGSVTNLSEVIVRHLRAVVTLFDMHQNVIAAGFSDLEPHELAAGASMDFEITVPEMGGDPTQYILNIQGLP